MSPRTSLLLILTLLPATRVHAQAPQEVEPAELANRKDLIGREVVVDDRVRMFFPSPGKGIVDILLKRTQVPIVLPPGLRYEVSPSARSVRARGILKMGETGLIIEATQAPELFRSDTDRLNKIIATIAPGDIEARSLWGAWAVKRGRAFDDAALVTIGDRLLTEATALERQSPSVRSPETLIALAKRARARGIAEPMPSSFLHLAFRLRLESAKTIEDYEKIADEVAAFLPDARNPGSAPSSPPPESYIKNPESGYAQADANTRKALDRRLWTDAVAATYPLRAARAAIPALLTLSNEAGSRLPDRPEVSGELTRRYYETSYDNVAKLRESEMRDLAKAYRDKLKQPEKATALTRNWLDNQREHFLAPNDADQRSDLARKYLDYLKDKKTAAVLLEEAERIDPASREVREMFQRMGYIKAGGTWRDPNDPSSRGSAAAPDDGRGPTKDDPLLGLTPAEVKAQIGDPKHSTRVITQARVSMQWIYEGSQGTQYIDFLQRAGDPNPVVVGRYTLR